MPSFRAGVCSRCRSEFGEIAARETSVRDEWPASLSVERCSCGAVVSFRYPDPESPGRWVRRRIER